MDLLSALPAPLPLLDPRCIGSSICRPRARASGVVRRLPPRLLRCLLSGGQCAVWPRTSRFALCVRPPRRQFEVASCTRGPPLRLPPSTAINGGKGSRALRFAKRSDPFSQLCSRNFLRRNSKRKRLKCALVFFSPCEFGAFRSLRFGGKAVMVGVSLWLAVSPLHAIRCFVRRNLHENSLKIAM